MTAPVKWFLSSHTGAPTLTGAPGAMQAILNACLVTGFNVSAVDSITRDGTTVTVTISAGHGLEPGVVVLISGADQAEYNGDFVITEADTTTFKYELASGLTPASPATGTIECRQAPAGWERPFVSGDNQRAAFRSPAAEATGLYFYIDDTNTQGTRRAGVKGYESMTDIDTGSNPFPYSSADDQWYWWYKSTDETTTRSWAVVADNRWAWIWWNAENDDNWDRQHLQGIGDLASFVPADVWNFVVTGDWNSANVNGFRNMLLSVTFEYTPGAQVGNSGVSLARDFLGTAATLSPGCSSVTDVPHDINHALAVGSRGLSWPSPVSGGTALAPVDLAEVSGGQKLLRGRLPGAWAPYHTDAFDPYLPQRVTGSGEFAGRSFLSLPFRGGAVDMSAGKETNSHYRDDINVYRGRVLVDITGPWRS